MSSPDERSAASDQSADPGARWLEESVASVASRTGVVSTFFPAVSRRCGRDPLVNDDPGGLIHGSIDDAARARLIEAIPARGAELVAIVGDLYRSGDAGEKRGVLRALHLVDEPLGDAGVGEALLPAVEDALRTNDIRLVAAAVQRYGIRHLSAEGYRHAIVKCVFMGIPLAAVPGLLSTPRRRADPELARMLVDLAHERIAAGRAVPDDVGRVIASFPEALDRPDLPTAVTDNIRSSATKR